MTTEWPVKPKGLDEDRWYREIEKDMVLSVLSSDPHDSTCPGCGERRIIYQHQELDSRPIRALCKSCTVKKAGGRPYWVRTGTLRETWARDGRDSRRRSRKAPSGNWTAG